MRRASELLANASPDRAREIEAAYEAEASRGPGFAQVRREARFAEMEATKLNREGLARLERSWAFLARKLTDADRKAAKARGGTTRRTLSRSTVDVLGALLYLARKHREVFASIEGIARLAGVCRRTACEALSALESWGVLRIVRRRKRIRTATGGVGEAQDTSIYVLHEPEGLAAMALRVFGFMKQASECKFRTASVNKNQVSNEKVRVASAPNPSQSLIPLPPCTPGGNRIPWHALIRPRAR